MNFDELKQGIQTLSDSFRQNAVLAVNTHLTVRNWLIGFYIVEFEQNGEDRAKYGARLLQNLADGFDEDGLSYRNLNLYRQFYRIYPQVSTYIPGFFQKYFGGIMQSPIAQLQSSGDERNEIVQSLTAQFNHQEGQKKHLSVEKLVNKLSFTHLTQMFSIEDPLNVCSTRSKA